MAKKKDTDTEAPSHELAPPSAEIVVETPAPEVVAAPAKTGLALFLDKYLNAATELSPLQWQQAPESASVCIGSKFGTLVWPDGSPAVFTRAEGQQIVNHLRPIRPNDQINLQPATT